MDIVGLDLHKRESQLASTAPDGTITDRRIVTSRDRLTAVLDACETGAYRPARRLADGRRHVRAQEEREKQIASKLPPGGATWAREEIVGFAESMAQYDLAFAKRGMALWSSNDKPVRDLIPAIRAPTLLMVAKSGGMPGVPSPIDDIRKTVSALPNVTLMELETSHFIRREAFDRYISAVSDQLSAFLAVS